MPPLLPHERAGRAVVVAAILLCGVLLWRWAPQLTAVAPGCVFHSVTGLPCAFCGGTRSVCAAAGGDWSRALELNAAGIVAVGFGVLLGIVACVEALRGRALVDWGLVWRRGVRFLPLVGALMMAWWGIHLLAAVRKQKTELVDFNHPVARRVAGWLGGSSTPERGAEGD